jgi:hypothetical protein
MGFSFHGMWITRKGENEDVWFAVVKNALGGRGVTAVMTKGGGARFQSDQTYVESAMATIAQGGGRVNGVITPQLNLPNDPHSHPPPNVNTHSCHSV